MDEKKTQGVWDRKWKKSVPGTESEHVKKNTFLTENDREKVWQVSGLKYSIIFLLTCWRMA